MIRCSAQGPQGRALIKDKAFISFLRTAECAKQSSDVSLKTDLLSRPRSFLARTISRASQNFGQDHSFEGTVYSLRHYSQETET